MPESLSLLQLAAIVAGYALALARLTDAARPLWHWVRPPWLQMALPALVTVLPDFAAALGLVKTPVDLVQSIAIAVGAMAAAMRGALPKAVFDKLPPEARADLKVAREGKRTVPPMPLLVVACTALLLVSCAGKPPTGAELYRGLLSFCAVYPQLPAELHNKANDVACLEASKLCSDTPLVTSPAISDSTDAGSAGAPPQ